MIELTPYEVQNVVATVVFIVALGGLTITKAVYEVLHWGRRD